MQTSTKLTEQWLRIAIGSLILAGLLSLILVIGRMPYLSQFITDPQFAKKCLVIHVNLAIFVWLFSCLTALFNLIPAGKPLEFKTHTAPVAMLGIGCFVISAAWPEAMPILSNYIPAIDHPLFFIGIALFSLAVAINLVDRRLFSGSNAGLPTHNATAGQMSLSPVTVDGLRGAGLAGLLAFAVILITAWRIDANYTPTMYYDLVFWGGGHVMQFANILGMLSVWLILLEASTGLTPISQKAARGLFGWLLLPLLFTPFLAWQVNTPFYQKSFTRLMQWGIFPAVSIFLIICLYTVYRAYRTGRISRSAFRHPAFMGFAASAGLTLVGFGLGAMIHRVDTLIPAHYHAAIGAVTVAYMAVAYRVWAALGYRIQSQRLTQAAGWQPALFGIGQAVFAVGFGLAKMARKVYGDEQIIQTATQHAGLVLMGIGGFIAIAGGITFIWIIAGLIYRYEPATSHFNSELKVVVKS